MDNNGQKQKQNNNSDHIDIEILFSKRLITDPPPSNVTSIAVFSV